MKTLSAGAKQPLTAGNKLEHWMGYSESDVNHIESGPRPSRISRFCWMWRYSVVRTEVKSEEEGGVAYYAILDCVELTVSPRSFKFENWLCWTDPTLAGVSRRTTVLVSCLDLDNLRASVGAVYNYNDDVTCTRKFLFVCSFLLILNEPALWQHVDDVRFRPSKLGVATKHRRCTRSK